MLNRRVRYFSMLWFTSMLLGVAFAADISGHVNSVQNGQALSQVSVTLSTGDGVSGPNEITTFTDKDGVFRFENVDIGSSGKATLHVFRLGYDSVSTSPNPVAIDPSSVGRLPPIDFLLEPTANIATQVSASAWLRDAPESIGKHVTQLQCIGCHQFPSPKVRHFTEAMEALAEQGNAGQGSVQQEGWRRMVRKEAWRAAIQYMRAKSYDIFPEGTSIDLAKIPWATVQSPQYSLFNAKDEELIADFLQKYAPKQFEYLPASGYSYGAPLAVTGKTTINEYHLPDTSLVREATVVRGSGYIWGADIQKNRILKLDPKTGEKSWFNVPSTPDYSGATGPHTIIGDRDGTVWVSLLESDRLGHFDPKTEQWQLYYLRPSDMNAKNFFGGQAMVHDISFGSQYEANYDPKGLLWLTLIGSNRFASVNPATKEVHHYDAPSEPGRSGLDVSLYSALLSSDGKCLWFAQLNGYVGCFNTDKLKVQNLLEPSHGSGPRRLTIEPNDTLWVPYFGSGQLLKYNGRTGKKLALYDLPDRSAAPYAVTWDERRKVVWIANSNADAVYRFDPATEKFSVIPLPRPQGYLRKVVVDPESGDLVTSYSNIPTGSGPSMALVIHPGD